MLIWSDNHMAEFLAELLRHKGLGENRHTTTCGTCHQSLMPSSDSIQKPRIVRCQDCFGGLMECVDCCLQRHARLPLHVLDVSFLIHHYGVLSVLILCTQGMDRPILGSEDTKGPGSDHSDGSL